MQPIKGLIMSKTPSCFVRCYGFLLRYSEWLENLSIDDENNYQ